VKLFRTETAHDDAYNEIVSLLREGGIVAYPTDTAYGLGADPSNPSAVDRIFQIKGRAETKPILLLVDSMAMAESVSEPPDIFYKIAGQFWPGPLTLVLPAAPTVLTSVSAGTNTIGIRWPIAPFATTLVSRLAGPITATSANRSGMPSAVSAEEVRAQLGESVDALIDGGVLPSRSGSTLMDLTSKTPVLLREGPVSFASLAEFLNGNIRRHVA
jgi:L-threonylcarbamoyladenylate synthase